MTLIRLALRNLGRHRRRSAFLGTAIALGTAVLVTMNAFSHGISVVLFDKVVVWVAGHAGIFSSEWGSTERQLFHDGPWLEKQLAQIPEIKRVEQSIGTFARAIGNGRADNVILVGVDLGAKLDAKELRELEESFRMVSGKWEDLKRTDVETPTVIAREKAKAMGVDSGDIIRLRFSDIHGSMQATRATVVGVFSTDNMFMQAPIFLELGQTRRLLGYRPYEYPGINLILHEPTRQAVPVAEKLQTLLQPGRASIAGILRTNGRSRMATVFPLRADSALRAGWAKRFSLPESLLTRKDVAIVGRSLADSFGIAANDAAGTVRLSWKKRYIDTVEDADAAQAVRDSAEAGLGRIWIVPDSLLPGNVVLWREEGFFKAYYGDLPPRGEAKPPVDTAWVSKEWNLLPRPRTTEEMQRQLADAGLARGRGATVSVRTMYEAASDIIKLEGVLNLITLSAVLVLFAIILIGVLNTLRMTVRERTREIGTIRALGMQARDVRNLFLLETLFLTLLSTAAGVVLGFVLMAVLRQIPFHAQDNPMGMLLVNSRLFFAPTWAGTLGGVFVILLMALATAWFPARRAARLPAAAALRHHE